MNKSRNQATLILVNLMSQHKPKKTEEDGGGGGVGTENENNSVLENICYQHLKIHAAFSSIL